MYPFSVFTVVTNFSTMSSSSLNSWIRCSASKSLLFHALGDPCAFTPLASYNVFYYSNDCLSSPLEAKAVSASLITSRSDRTWKRTIKPWRRHDFCMTRRAEGPQSSFHVRQWRYKKEISLKKSSEIFCISYSGSWKSVDEPSTALTAWLASWRFSLGPCLNVTGTIRLIFSFVCPLLLSLQKTPH